MEITFHLGQRTGSKHLDGEALIYVTNILGNTLFSSYVKRNQTTTR